jgi:large subunit ribosomal protein L9
VPEAILLKDVEGIGSRGAVVDVSKGYLRNFLIPRKLAQPATKGALNEARRLQESHDREAAVRRARAEEHAEQLNKTVLTISQQAGEDGRLFGSVTGQEIVDAVKQARGLRLDKRGVKLDEPIKTTGTHMVTVEVAEGVTAEVKTIVTPEA